MSNERLFGVTAAEAKKYFLESKNYFTVPLPEYFNFTRLLNEIDQKIRDLAKLKGVPELKISDLENPRLPLRKAKHVNYRLVASKNGRNAWRTFRLIHPVVYVRLTQIITKPENWSRLVERLNLFGKQTSVVCTSLAPGIDTGKKTTPAGILKWWNGMERGTIRLALHYDYVMETDILECYDSIDVDLVRKAIGGDAGAEIAELIAESEGGRRIGIPQGSTLVDLIAELVFGWLDVILDRAIKTAYPKLDYQILRYRDDYRIFTKDKISAENITRILHNILADVGLKLNSGKTVLHDDIIAMSRKKDKTAWEKKKPQTGSGILKTLLLIYDHAREYPNTGSVQRALIELYEQQIFPLEIPPRDIEQIMSVVVELITFNPRSSAICIAILSKMLSFNPDSSRSFIADRVMERAGALPHTEHLELCLQRLTARSKTGKKYHQSRLCQALYDSSTHIWNSDWITSIKVRDQVGIKREDLKTIPYVVPLEEVSAFYHYSDDEDDEDENDEGDDKNGENSTSVVDQFLASLH